MSEVDEFSFSPEEFSGIARLFPLPNLVMFPHVLQPLQIFEPRYCEMLHDALDTDRLLATALLEPGWEPDYEGRPAIARVVCLGRIISHRELEHDRHNLLLMGLRRAVVIDELPALRRYREAEVELMEDEYPASAAADRGTLRRRLLACFQQIVPKTSDAQEQIERLLGSDAPLGMLTDIVSYTLNLKMAWKQDLLAETNVDRRATALLEHLSAVLVGAVPAGGEAGFPPDFSAN